MLRRYREFVENRRREARALSAAHPATSCRPSGSYEEHFRLLADKSAYFYEEATPEAYQRAESDPRIVAFYLPQFHPIEENDRAWGKGFTEWTNVASNRARFVGHWQPILPADLGFYDLRLDSVIQDQIGLAKQYGLYGFCFHYYWFSGRRLLERPLDTFLKHSEWDFNFAISWANENWTKRWDGHEKDVIVQQEYRDEDALRFIRDVEPILLEPRYIRHEGKPMLLVYRVPELPDPARWTTTWREYFRTRHGLDLHLVAISSFDIDDPRRFGFDAAVDHAPLTVSRKHLSEGTHFPTLNVESELLDPDFSGQVFDYRAVALNRRHDSYLRFPHYTSVMPSWDNDARRRGKGSTIFFLENPDLYGKWLDAAITKRQTEEKAPLVLVNAWNEWAEGAIMEPSRHYGAAILRRTAEVLSGHSHDARNRGAFPLHGLRRRPGVDLAVIVHLYYPDRWDPINSRLSCIDACRYDLYVTLDFQSAEFAQVIRGSRPEATILTVPNRGRDVLPFVHLARRLSEHGYEGLLKLHSKKSSHRQDGDWWFGDLISKLLPSSEGVQAILDVLKETGAMIGPAGHFHSLEMYLGSNVPHLRRLLSSMLGTSRADSVLSSPADYGFFAGTMFWSSFSAIRSILELHLAPEDFESEDGQYDGTMAHAVERALGLAPREASLKLMQSDGHSIRDVTPSDIVTTWS